MQKEIEIKIKINFEQLEILQKWLINHAQKGDLLIITDYYLNNPTSTFYSDSGKGYKDGLQFLRVRITPKDHFVCYKKRNIDSNGKTLSVEETEVEVSDGNKILEILRAIGFSDQIIIKKKRQIYLVDNKFEIAIDVVEDLGTFVEVELKNQFDDVEQGLNKIYELLRKIGIKEFISFDRGYLCMVLNPSYDFGRKVSF